MDAGKRRAENREEIEPQTLEDLTESEKERIRRGGVRLYPTRR